MTKEDILKHQITAQYKNVSTFCEKTGIPESTVRNIFKRGFDGVGTNYTINITPKKSPGKPCKSKASGVSCCPE